MSEVVRGRPHRGPVPQADAAYMALCEDDAGAVCCFSCGCSERRLSKRRDGLMICDVCAAETVPCEAPRLRIGVPRCTWEGPGAQTTLANGYFMCPACVELRHGVQV